MGLGDNVSQFAARTAHRLVQSAKAIVALGRKDEELQGQINALKMTPPLGAYHDTWLGYCHSHNTTTHLGQVQPLSGAPNGSSSSREGPLYDVHIAGSISIEDSVVIVFQTGVAACPLAAIPLNIMDLFYPCS
jgi:hypothetical protein